MKSILANFDETIQLEQTLLPLLPPINNISLKNRTKKHKPKITHAVKEPVKLEQVDLIRKMSSLSNFPSINQISKPSSRRLQVRNGREEPWKPFTEKVLPLNTQKPRKKETKRTKLPPIKPIQKPSSPDTLTTTLEVKTLEAHHRQLDILVKSILADASKRQSRVKNIQLKRNERVHEAIFKSVQERVGSGITRGEIRRRRMQEFLDLIYAHPNAIFLGWEGGTEITVLK